MQNSDSFILIDGSHLFSSIEKIKKTKKVYLKQKLNLGYFTESVKRVWSFYSGVPIRVNFYFRKGDPRIKEMLIVPKVSIPGEKDNWQVIECGEKNKAIPHKIIENIDLKYRDNVHRLEKGLDTRLTCDALLYVAKQMASKIVFLVNDGDYLPLFQAIQQLGGSVYLTSLDSKQSIHGELCKLCDKYLSLDAELDYVFGIVKTIKTEGEQTFKQVEV